MELNRIKETIRQQNYNFLNANENLGDNIILLGLGGSHAYGTDNENSDLDIRGVATNTIRNIFIGHDFEQVVDTETDTTIYSFDKIIKLLCNCNPNVIELMGLKPEHYLYLSDIGKELLANKGLFLSKLAVHSFGGYSRQQLRRLESAVSRTIGQSQMEQHILKSVEYARFDYKVKFFPTREYDSIDLYIDDAVNKDLDDEIFMDINLTHYPLRDYLGMWSDMKNIVSGYTKIGQRNKKALEHDKVEKHCVHLVRLYSMCIDILSKGEIKTYREKEHNLLMDIRNGKYSDENHKPNKEFYDIVSSLEADMDYWKQHTDLPEKPDKKKIEDFVFSVNKSVALQNLS